MPYFIDLRESGRAARLARDVDQVQAFFTLPRTRDRLRLFVPEEARQAVEREINQFR